MEYILSALIGYFLGSIPFALVIGKVFYKKDVRNYGSGNLGATNTGRVLGKKAGAAVMVLDVLKVVFAIWLVTLFNKDGAIIAGLMAGFGHCYPIFANFKGGKAVSTFFGYLFGMSAFVFGNYTLFLVPFIAFIIFLYLSKMVSLASMLASLVAFGFTIFFTNNLVLQVSVGVFSLFIIYRHRSNITKIMNKTESKITWM